jgi:hypothetical protein
LADPYDPERAVIDFNKFFAGPFSYAFRVSVHEDGTVIYEGIKRVKVPGTKVFSVEPKAVEDLVDAYLKAGFASVQEVDTRGVADAEKSVTITVKHAKITKSVTLSPNLQSRTYWRYLSLLEIAIPTRSLRCPYVNRFNHDVCRYDDRELQRLIDSKR